MRLGERWVASERRLVGRDRPFEIAGIGEPRTPLDQCAGILPECVNGLEDRIPQRRPSRAELGVALQLGLSLVTFAGRPVREGQRIVRGTELREQRDSPFETLDGFRVPPLRRRDPAETELDRGLASGVFQLREQPCALFEIAGVEKRFREPDPCRKVVGRDLQSFAELDDRIRRQSETLEHDCVEIRPVERSWRQSLDTSVCFVRGVPLLPGVEHARKRADRLLVVRLRGSDAMGLRDVVACCRRIRVEREAGEWGLGADADEAMPADRRSAANRLESHVRQNTNESRLSPLASRERSASGPREQSRPAAERGGGAPRL